MLSVQRFAQGLCLMVCLTSLLLGCSALKLSKKTPVKASTPSSVQQLPVLALQKVWKKSLSEPINATPISIQNASRLIVSQDNAIYQYDMATGKTVWRRAIAGVTQSFLAVDASERLLLAWLKGGEAVALHTTTGEVLWRKRLSVNVQAAPIILNGVALVLSTDGRLLGLDAATGDQRWALFRVVPRVSLRASGAIAAFNASKAIVGFPGGLVMLVNVATGEVSWEKKLSVIQGSNEIERISDVLPNWVLHPKLGACASIYLQSMVCINEVGTTTYQQFVKSTLGLVASADTWFTLDSSAAVKAWSFMPSTMLNEGQNKLSLAYTMMNFEPAWLIEPLKNQKMAHPFLSLAANRQNHLFSIDAKGTVYALSANTGTPLAQVKIGLVPKETVALVPVSLNARPSVIVGTGEHLSVWSMP
jgi:outer membrane protein assembly factor BamB